MCQQVNASPKFNSADNFLPKDVLLDVLQGLVGVSFIVMSTTVIILPNEVI